MKKHDIFAFTAPNGVEVTAIVVQTVLKGCVERIDICYAQNKLFTMVETECGMDENNKWLWDISYGEIISDYVIIPEYDAMLENYQHQLDMADDYASREY